MVIDKVHSVLTVLLDTRSMQCYCTKEISSEKEPMNSSQIITKVESSTEHCVSLKDADLVMECQRGNGNALTHLLKRHERTIAAMLYRLAPDLSDSSDIQQEASIRIWRSIHNLRNPALFKSWLNQIVTNLFYDELRRRPRDFVVVSIDAPLVNKDGVESGVRDIVDYSPQPEEKALRRELSKVLVNAISQISALSRTAIVLRDVDGLSYSEIASITSTEMGTVKSRIARARVKVQDLVGAYLQSAA